MENTIFNLVQDVAVGDLDLANIEKRFVRVEKDDDGDEEAEEAELIWDVILIKMQKGRIY